MRNDTAHPSSEPHALATHSYPCDEKRVFQHLARNVKHFRNTKNITQDDLADKSGIFRTYLSRIETGRGNPSLAVLVALAAALEVSPHVLLMAME